MLSSPMLTEASQEAAFRQLRHQTKNALQRILSQIAQTRDLQTTPHGQRLISDLERRVMASSAVSDALFGVTSRPGALADRLRRLVDATAELLGDPDQLLRVDVSVEPGTEAALDDTILRIVHEFVGNAIKHGLYARSVGVLTVKVGLHGRGVRAEVLDDGWGCKGEPAHGEGLRLATLLAAQHRGTVTLQRRHGLTVAEALLHPA